MIPLVPLLVEGLAAGAIPGLLGLGLALVHRTTGVLSFAQAGIGAAGAYAAFSMSGLMPPVGGLLVAAGAGALAALPLPVLLPGTLDRRREAAILVTLGYGLLLELGTRIGFGSDVRAFLHVFREEAPILVPGGSVPQSSLLLLVLTVGLGTGVGVLTGRGRVGLALRAVGADPVAASALGVRRVRWERLAWALSGGIAGVSGWLLAPRLGLEPQLLWGPMVVGFVAAAIGGLDHPLRALLAGLLLGVLDRGLAAAIGPEASMVARGGVYLLVLLRQRGD